MTIFVIFRQISADIIKNSDQNNFFWYFGKLLIFSSFCLTFSFLLSFLYSHMFNISKIGLRSSLWTSFFDPDTSLLSEVLSKVSLKICIMLILVLCYTNFTISLFKTICFTSNFNKTSILQWTPSSQLYLNIKKKWESNADYPILIETKSMILCLF